LREQLHARGPEAGEEHRYHDLVPVESRSAAELIELHRRIGRLEGELWAERLGRRLDHMTFWMIALSFLGQVFVAAVVLLAFR